MLEMVRQQMICIIAPRWRGAVDFSESGSMYPALETLFGNIEVVQFATIALLPARADSQEQLPSLMLELAIEEGINPRDMLYRLDVVALQLVLARRWSCPGERAQRAIARQADGVAQHRRRRLRRRPRPNGPADQEGAGAP